MKTLPQMLVSGLAVSLVAGVAWAQPAEPPAQRQQTDTPPAATEMRPERPERSEPRPMRPARELVIAESMDAVVPLAVGDRMPPARVRNMAGEPVNLRAAAAGAEGTLVIFFRGGWCPYCNTHLAELATMKDEFAERGVRVLALSPDSPEKLNEREGAADAGYVLLSDSQFAAASAFGVAYAIDDAGAERMRGYGLDLAEWSGNAETRALPVASAFLVDKTGTIRFVHLSRDYRERVSAETLRAELDKLKVEAAAPEAIEDAQPANAEDAPQGPAVRLRVRQ